MNDGTADFTPAGIKVFIAPAVCLTLTIVNGLFSI